MLKTAVSENLVYFLSKEDGVNHLPSDFQFFRQRSYFPFMLHSITFAGIREIDTGYQNKTHLRNVAKVW